MSTVTNTYKKMERKMILLSILCLVCLPLTKCDAQNPPIYDEDELTDCPDEGEEPDYGGNDQTPAPEQITEPSPTPPSEPITEPSPTPPTEPITEPSPTPPLEPTPEPTPEESSAGYVFLPLLNEARQKAGSISNLIWNDDLGKRAQDMANTCVKIREKYNFKGILTYVNKPEDAYSPETVVQNWLNKVRYTDNGDTTACCSEASTTCCRYAKVVDPKYQYVGCGYKFCQNLKFGSVLYPNRQAVICMFRES